MREPEFKHFEVKAWKPDGTEITFTVVTTYTDLASSGITSNVYRAEPTEDLATAMTDLIRATRTAAMRKFP